VQGILAIVMLLGAVVHAAADDRVLGLLALPEVFGAGACAVFEPVDVPVHAAPNDGKPMAVIRVDRNWSFAPHGGCEGLQVSVHRGADRHELPTREFDYEMPGAIVLDRREGWFKVRLHDGPGWIKPSVVDRFMPLADLFEEFVGVTAINRSFTSRLASAPGELAGPILPRVVPSQPVRVVEIRESSGSPWVHVEVLGNSVCTAADHGPPQVIAAGWLPLHDADGEPSIWFSSRGCE
jgi:hypothetical protein